MTFDQQADACTCVACRSYDAFARPLERVTVRCGAFVASALGSIGDVERVELDPIDVAAMRDVEGRNGPARLIDGMSDYA